jgi:hypothetical protein
MERPRFIADADFNQDIIDGVLRRDPECDFLNADQGGTRGLDDPSILRLAAASGRILVSHDRNTMPAHFYEFIKEADSPGLIIVSQRFPIGAAVEALLLLASASDLSEYRQSITWIPLSPGA